MLTEEDRKRIEEQKTGILAELYFNKGYTEEELAKVLDSKILDINDKIVQYAGKETANLPEEAASFLKKHILNEYDIVYYYLIFKELEKNSTGEMNRENLSILLNCLRKWLKDLAPDDILSKLHEL